jgi:DNA excision repair protein ERCC-2
LTIRWDEKTRRLSMSVRDLAEDQQRRYGGVSMLPMLRRAQLGRQEHELQQSAREQELADYRRELSVSWTFPHKTAEGDLTVHIQGRIDGVYIENGTLIIEEIKTVIADAKSLAALHASAYPHYIRQLQLYQWLVEHGSWNWPGHDQRYPDTELHLLIVALPERQSRVIPIDYDEQDCQGFVQARLCEIIGRIEAGAKQRARRRGMVDKLRFPFKKTRIFQRELMDKVHDALEQDKNILISAATGSGKTIAALLPALRKSLEIGGRVFVATSKTTQQQIFMDTLQLLSSEELPLHGVVLTAREKVCQNDVVLCHPDRCTYIENYDTKIDSSGVLKELRKLPVINAQTFISEGQKIGACPFFMAFDSLRDADVIIGDYNYAFDPGAAVRQLFVDEPPSDIVLIIDEAHNLADRARGYYSPEVSRALLTEFEDFTFMQGDDSLLAKMRLVVRELDQHLNALETGRELPDLDGQEAKIAEDLVKEELAKAGDKKGGNLLLFDDPELSANEDKRLEKQRARAHKKQARKRPRPGHTPPKVMRDKSLSWVPRERCIEPDKGFFERIRTQFEDLIITYFIEQARGRRPVFEEDPVIRVHRALARLVTVLDMFDESFSAIFSRGSAHGDGALKILCKDPSGPLSQRIKDCAATVAISATLLPFEFYRTLLGFPEDTAYAEFASPFPPENRKILIDTRMTTRYQRRREEEPLIAEAIRAVVNSHEGNILVCFPSYHYMDQVALRIDRDQFDCDVIMQRPGMSDPERRAVLERLAAYDPARSRQLPPVLLLTVQGGVFTEGVDYPGDMCVGVVLVGPGLPKLCFERRLIQAYFEQKYQRGFDFAYLYPGMNRVIQAAGRVHRRDDDAGVIVLLGSRFLQRPYARLLPQYWYQHHPSELRSHSLEHELQGFWQAVNSRSTDQLSSPEGAA